MEELSGSSSDSPGGVSGAAPPSHPQNTDPDESISDYSSDSDYIPTDDEEDSDFDSDSSSSWKSDSDCDSDLQIASSQTSLS